MKTIISIIKMTLLTMIVFVIVYATLVYAIAQLVPYQGKGKTLTLKGKLVGFEQIGQNFSQDKYFWGRPSAVGFNATGSGGSNKGPSNTDYLQTVQARIDTFLAHHPTVLKNQIPAELVTASGSGLDPHISPEAAAIQVARIARVRQLSEAQIHKLIDSKTEKSLLGLFGTAKVNVLQLNLALEAL